jgi:hypothetical protein
VIAPTWRTSVDVVSSDTYDEDQEKRDDVRSILSINTASLECFRPSHEVIVIRTVFTVL